MAQWYVDETRWNLVAKYLKNSVIFGRKKKNDGQTRSPLGGFWQGVPGTVSKIVRRHVQGTPLERIVLVTF